MKEFADRLKQAQEQRGLNQKEMAALLNITPATYSAYINNVKTPALDVAIRIADKLAVSMSWLCGDNREAAPKLTTYEDLLRTFVAIADTTRIRFAPNIEKTQVLTTSFGITAEHDEKRLFSSSEDIQDYFQDGQILYEGPSGECRYASFDTRDYTILNFFEGWAKIRELYENGPIDEEMYTSWLEKRFRELSEMRLPAFQNVE